MSKDLQGALASLAAGDFTSAERLIRSSLEASPEDVNAWHLLGLIRARCNDHQSALQCFDQVLRRENERAKVWASRGEALSRLRRHEEALASYDSALTREPGEADWWHERGTELVSLQRFEAALDSFQRALALDAKRVQTISARGVALEGLHRDEEAASCYRHALQLAPDYATAHSNLGRLLRKGGDLRGAIESFRSAIALNPGFALAHHNLGCALEDVEDFRASIESYRRALAIEPRMAECEYSLAVALLKTQDFAPGWRAFESRLRFRVHSVITPPAGVASWTGGPLGGKTLLLLAEAGAGDVIQFSRYGAQLNARGIRPVLQISDRLAAIIRTSGYFAATHAPGAELESDRYVWCSLMSLPLHFQTDATCIPAPIPYLRADARRIDEWRERLRGVGGFRVGIVWQGNPGAEIGALQGRSMRAQELEPLATLPGVSLISLQRGAGREQLQSSTFGKPILDLGGELDGGADAFVDTAAVVANLDLVVTVDTSIAHLAGALGAPVWVALHRTSDWRWFQTSARSPWYPTMTLYRQARANDWISVVGGMREALQAKLAEASRKAVPPRRI